MGIIGNVERITEALESADNMNDYLECATTHQIIADIKAYKNQIDEQRFTAALSAMQGLLANKYTYGVPKSELASDAINIADALIAELNKLSVK